MGKTIRIQKQNGEVWNGRSLLIQLGDVLKDLPNGEYVLTVSKRKTKRTVPQNRLFWLWMACIEKETGTSKEDCHDYYCSLFLRRNVTVNGNEREVVGGTSGLNTVQFRYFLDRIQADAATEINIALPNPEDLYWEEFYKHYSQFI